MTDWSKHVHRFAKKHNMTYKKANVSRKCKETYKKRRTSPRRKSPRRKRRMNTFSMRKYKETDPKFTIQDYENAEAVSDAILAVQDANRDLNSKLADARSRNASQKELNQITEDGMEKIAIAKEEFKSIADQYKNLAGQTRSGRSGRTDGIRGNVRWTML